MALRSPVEFHNFWGINSPTTNAFWLVGELPNENLGNPDYYGNDNVQVGDFAYVDAAATFYVCTAAGTSAGGGATWVAIATGPVADADRFAPKYLVGGPSDTAASLPGTEGFWFFPDTGDGAGIEAAISAAGVLAGDVYIRPGTFNLTGVSSFPLVVPADVRVVGAGNTTVLQHSFAAGSGTVFQLGAGAELRDMKIEVTDTGDGSGNGVVEATGIGRAYCERVEVSLTRDPASTSTLLAAFFADDGATLEQDRCVALLDGTNSTPGQPPTPPIPADALAGWRASAGSIGGKLRLDMVRHIGGDAGVVAFGQTDVDESSFNQFGVVGVYCAGADLAVTGGTKLVSTNPAAIGIQIAQTVSDINLLVNARISLSVDQATSVGILSDAATGQITASRISAETGIDTSAGAGAGVAIGFNVINGTSQIVPNGTTDEVAHNILF
jgi:hypothetical protein